MAARLRSRGASAVTTAAPSRHHAGLLDVAGISVAFGGLKALTDVSFAVTEGEICGLIGPNGAGKTTLFNCVTRIYQPVSGSVSFDGHDLLQRKPADIGPLGISRTFQNLGLFGSLTCHENVMLGVAMGREPSFIASGLRWPTARKFERETQSRADEVLAEFGIEHLRDHRAQELPYGTLKRLELARAVASSPRLLMLDEPAGGLTHSEVEEFSELMRRIRDSYGLTLMLVEHNVKMVMSLCDHVIALNLGQKIADGAPDEVRSAPEVVASYIGEGE